MWQVLTVFLFLLHIWVWQFGRWLWWCDHIFGILDHFRIASILSECLPSAPVWFALHPIFLVLIIEYLLDSLDVADLVERWDRILEYTLCLAVRVFRIQFVVIASMEVLHSAPLKHIDVFVDGSFFLKQLPYFPVSVGSVFTKGINWFWMLHLLDRCFLHGSWRSVAFGLIVCRNGDVVGILGCWVLGFDSSVVFLVIWDLA